VEAEIEGFQFWVNGLERKNRRPSCFWASKALKRKRGGGGGGSPQAAIYRFRPVNVRKAETPRRPRTALAIQKEGKGGGTETISGR